MATDPACAENAHGGRFRQSLANQKAVSDRIVQFVNEVANQLALGDNRVAGDRMDEIANEETGSYRVTRNIDLMDKAADQLALGSNRVAGDRMDEITDEMTEILHLKPFQTSMGRTLRAPIA